MTTLVKLSSSISTVSVLKKTWNLQNVSSTKFFLSSRCTAKCMVALIRTNVLHPLDHRHISTTAVSCTQRSVSQTPIISNVKKYGNKLAVIDSAGSYSYEQLYRKSQCLSNILSNYLSTGDRVTFLCDDVSYAVTKLAIWMNAGIAVPLCAVHSAKEWQYFIQDSDSSLIMTTKKYEAKLREVAKSTGKPFLVFDIDTLTESVSVNGKDISTIQNSQENISRVGEIDNSVESQATSNEIVSETDTPALIIYTSGTTGQPKGVVLSHKNLLTNIKDMIKVWEWRNDDVILHCLPLHHVHGVVNTLLTPLFVGATCVMMKFDAKNVIQALIGDTLQSQYGMRISIFMAVPTIYAKLMEEVKKQSISQNCENNETSLRKQLKQIRLMVSGSAALPEEILQRWQNLTSHLLLERYGMTEIGMALTNPLHGERVPGTVGNPFPSVQVRIVQPNTEAEFGYDLIVEGDSSKVTKVAGMENEQGELLVKGTGVFKEYWGKKAATEQSFTKDGWFKTGDEAVFKDGSFKILGRMSVDIIKSGGYKISALYIEQCLLTHPNIIDCAVVGLPDLTWGQKVAAVIVMDSDQPMTTQDLKQWAKDKLASYMIPTVVENLPSMPRNAMGKVNKKDLIKTVFKNH